jgi:starch-binding outer membrane protein, SusD/RagB family
MRNIAAQLFILCTFFLSACKKFVEVPMPKNELATSAVFEDSTGCVSAVNGIYIDMIQNFNPVITNGGLTIFTGLSSDELFPTSTNIDQKNFYENDIALSNFINQGQLWAYAYKLIYETNACIDGLAKSKGVTESLKNRLNAECKFIRAFLYFNLVNLYGDVPLVTSTDYHVTKLLSRSAINTVYSQIITDLNDVKNVLSAGKTLYRPSRCAASALLSKIYLYQKDWAKAETESSSIINAGLYILEANLNNVFLKNSGETIFALEPVIPNRETMEGLYFVPNSSTRRPTYAVTDFLMNAFETGDLRKTTWTKSNTIGGQQYFYPFKYKQWFRIVGSASTESYTVFRLAEQYLIRAEARAQLNNLVGAIDDINKLRSRAGINELLNSLDQNQILIAIGQERRTELFCEWGNRWFDLKRTEMADTILGSIKPNWKSTAVLYPIPQSERDNNPNLSQNGGY